MKINQKNLALVLFIIAGVFILGGIALLAFAVPNASATFYRICFVLIALLCLLIGVGVLFWLYLARDNDPNFFLYDTKTGRNIDADALTFERVNNRMSYFMTTLSSSLERLWSDNILDINPGRFGVREVYKPLAAYKMLYDLVELDRPEGWQMFLCASPAVIDSLTDALGRAGEDDMIKKLRHAYNNASGRDDFEWIRDYLTGNQKYLKGRMMGYVQKHMEWFY